jgi:methionine-rich copper-binding protein CopC
MSGIDEFPSNAGTNGSLIADGAPGFGEVNTIGDTDWFRISLIAGRAYTFYLEADTSSTAPLLDPVLTLYGPTSSQITTNDDATPQVRYSQISYTAPTSGNYYLEARGFGVEIGSYVLSAFGAVTVDNSAPQLTGVQPVDNAVDVSSSSNLVLTFDEAMQLGTGNIVLRYTDGSIARTISAAGVSISGNIVSIDPGADLIAGTRYTLEVDAGALRDLAGNPFAGITGTSAIDFTIFDDYPFSLGTTGSVIVGGRASAGAITSPEDRDLFKVDLVQGTSYRFTLTGNGGVQFDPYLDLYGPDAMWIAGDDDSGGGINAAIDFVPTVTGTYYLSARDLLVTSTGTYSLLAQAVDTAGPTLISASPADNSDGVAVGTALVLTFSEPISAGSGDIVLHNANGTVARRISITNINQVTIGTSSLTIDPGADLAAGTSYYVNMAPGVVTDQNGNPFAGITGATALNFTTLSDTDTSAPRVVGSSPADNALTVAPGANVVLTFSETVRSAGAAGLDDIVLRNSDGSVWRAIEVSDVSQVSVSGTTVTINPSIDFTPGRSYYLNIAAGAFSDVAGNAFGGITSATALNFTVPAETTSDGTIFGTSGPDSMGGTSAADRLSGAGGNDTINGGAGNDILAGGGGNDLIDGGLGLDTAVFNGNFADHTMGWSNGDWFVTAPNPVLSNTGTDTLRSIEYLQFDDRRVSFLEWMLGTPSAADTSFASVHRYLNKDNGHYFYTGSAQERASIAANYPQMQSQGEKFLAQDNWVTGYIPVYGFVNTLDGSRFYTINPAERDIVLSDYTQFRYEAPSFFVPSTSGEDIVTVWRLANLTADGYGKGAYLYTADAQERAALLGAGGWRDDGFAFHGLDPAFDDPAPGPGPGPGPIPGPIPPENPSGN